MTSVQIQNGSTAGSSRLIGLDAGRVIASLATVWYHSATSHDFSMLAGIARFAVSYFSLTAALMLVSSLRRRPEQRFSDNAASRIRRLYLPFLGWTAIYFVAGQVKNRFFTHGQSAELRWSLLWEGGNYVLWFLPYLLVMTLAAFPIIKFAVRSRRREIALGVVVLAAGIVMAIMPWHGDLDDQPLTFLGEQFAIPFGIAKSWARAPSYFWGLAFALLWRPVGIATGSSPRLPAWASVVGAALMAGSMWGNYTLGHINALENLTGLGLFLIALGPTPLASARGLASMGALTYGIYLSHWLFVDGLQKTMDRLHIEHHWWTDTGVFAAGAAAAIALTLLLRRTRYTRWLTP